MKSWVLALAIAILGSCGNAKPEAGRPASGTGGAGTGDAGGPPTGMGGGGGAFGGTDAVDAGPDDTDTAPTVTDAAPDVTDAAPDDTDAAPDVTDAAPDVTDAAPADGGANPGVPAPACDGVLPVCVPPVASYAQDVAPILNAKCNNCHSPEPDKPWPLDTYSNVVVWADLVIESLTHCTMPPTDGGTPSLTPVEHHTITNWLACQAPDN